MLTDQPSSEELPAGGGSKQRPTLAQCAERERLRTLNPKWVVFSKPLLSGPRKLFVRGAVGMEDTQETRPPRHTRTVHIGTPGDCGSIRRACTGLSQVGSQC